MSAGNWRNTTIHYGYIAQALHWVFVVAFLTMFVIAEVMMHMTKDPTNTFFGQGKWDLYALHKSIGVTLFFLIVLRVLWKLSNPIPAIIGHGLQKLLAKIIHFGLYGIMIIFPVSGYIMSTAGGHGVKFFGFPLPSLLAENKELSEVAHNLHHWAAEATYWLVFLHIAGALFHHYVIKDETFIRMFWRGDTKHKQQS